VKKSNAWATGLAMHNINATRPASESVTGRLIISSFLVQAYTIGLNKRNYLLAIPDINICLFNLRFSRDGFRYFNVKKYLLWVYVRIN